MLGLCLLDDSALKTMLKTYICRLPYPSIAVERIPARSIYEAIAIFQDKHGVQPSLVRVG